MKQSTVIEVVTPESLKEVVREVFSEELQKAISETFSNQTYYTRKEAAKKARISLPTLDKYVQEGKIKAHRLGARILFAEEDLKSAIEQMSDIKYARI